ARHPRPRRERLRSAPITRRPSDGPSRRTPIPRPASRRDPRAAPPPPRPLSASCRQLSLRASHTIISRYSIQISYLTSKYTGDHEGFTLSCSIEQSFFRTVVVHAPVTGSRGPRVGRGSRLAGPRPGTGALAGPGPRARRASWGGGAGGLRAVHGGGAGRDRRGRRR